MKIVLVGFDMAPTLFFKLLKSVFAENHPCINVDMFIGSGKAIEADESTIRNSVQTADLVILGLSSSPQTAHMEVIAAHHASNAQVPFGYYSDMSLCPFRPWLANIAPSASFIFGLLPHDTSPVSEMYPKAIIAQTGNPFREEMAYPNYSRSEIRDRLDIPLDGKLVIAAGTKFVPGNIEVWETLIEALSGIHRVTVLFSPHPGDVTLNTEGTIPPLYHEVFKHAKSTRVLFNTIPGPEAIAGADVVVNFTGDMSVRAAYQRIPLVNAVTSQQLLQFESETGSQFVETGGNMAGVTLGEFAPSSLKNVICELLDPSTKLSHNLRRAQEDAYPLNSSERGGTVRAIQDLIMSFLH